MSVAGIIVDPETGELKGTIEHGDRVTKYKSIEFLKDQEKAPKSETFTKLYHAMIPILAECGLTASEFIVFMYLSSNLKYQSNVTKDSNNDLITRKGIESNLRLSEITVKRTMSRLIGHGLIVETITKEGRAFIVNPFVVSVGDTMSKTVYDLFRKSKWSRW